MRYSSSNVKRKRRGESRSRKNPTQNSGAAAGAIGGAAIGAMLGGPAGAVVGGFIGLVVGNESDKKIRR